MSNYKKHTPIFSKPLIETDSCDCENCENKYTCADSNLAEKCDKMQKVIKEACPEDATKSGGGCKKADNSGYYKGVCDTGYVYDPTVSSPNKCIKISKG